MELPEAAIREALVNAIAHRDYRSSANVQMYVFHDRLEIVTPGGLPAGMREEDLGVKSVPRNLLLFGMFHRMGMVEQIGSGIRRIRQECRDYGVAEPLIEVSENWMTMTFPRPTAQTGRTADAQWPRTTPPAVQEAQDEVQELRQVAQRVDHEAHDEAHEAHEAHDEDRKALQDWEIAVLMACAVQPATRRELLAASGYSTRTGNFKRAIEKHLAMNLLELTIPDRPRSRRQKYRLTAAGRQMLAEMAETKKGSLRSLSDRPGPG